MDLDPEQIENIDFTVIERITVTIRDHYRTMYSHYTMHALEKGFKKWVKRITQAPVVLVMVRPDGGDCQDLQSWMQVDGDGTRTYEELVTKLIHGHGRYSYVLPETYKGYLNDLFPDVPYNGDHHSDQPDDRVDADTYKMRHSVCDPDYIDFHNAGLAGFTPFDGNLTRHEPRDLQQRIPQILIMGSEAWRNPPVPEYHAVIRPPPLTQQQLNENEAARIAHANEAFTPVHLGTLFLSQA